LPAWLFYSLLALLFWGFWAFLPKLATKTLDPPTTLFFQQVGAMVMAACVLAAARFRLKIEPSGISWALLTGIVGVCGLLCFLQAAVRYRLSVVVMLTALYPILTMILSVAILREKVTPLQGLGILLALCAIALMSTPSK
jgi:transporter family protein